MIEEEIWKEIPFLKGRYEASSLGRIRNSKTGKLRKLQNNGKDYLVFMIKLIGKNKNYYVHRCVLSSFNFVEDWEILQVNHKDFNTLNNIITNLEWLDCKDNTNYSRINNRFLEANSKQSERLKNLGKDNPIFTDEARIKSLNTRKANYKKENHPFYKKYGENSSFHKLTSSQVLDIRRIVSRGKSMNSTAKDFGVSYSTIRSVVNNETWKNIK